MKRSSYPEVSESLVGQSGVTISALDPKGTVRVAGERWSAVSDSEESIPEGEEVIVSDVEGLILMVFKASIARK
jgi:membrane-bound serine protease (ClpP class)